MKKYTLLLMMLLLALTGCNDAGDASDTRGISLDSKPNRNMRRGHNRAFVRNKLQRLDESNGYGNSKKPLLFYYAVDTEEPFMQMATDYEVRALKASCNRRIDTNFIVFLNSYFVKASRLFIYCKSGQLSYGNIEGLDPIVAKISDPDFDNNNPTGDLSIPLGHERKWNKMFAQYPFAHPEVLWGLIESTALDIFPVEDYKYFMHLRSHGGSELLLSGLTPDLLKKKNKVQVPVEKKYRLAMAEISFPNNSQGLVTKCEAMGGYVKDGRCYCYRGGYDSETRSCKRVYGTAGLGDSLPGGLAYQSVNLGRSEGSKNIPKIFSIMGWQGEGMGWLGEGMGWIGEGMGWQGEGMGYVGEGMGWQGEGMGWQAEGMGWYGEGMGWQAEGLGWLGEGMGWQGEGMGWYGEGLGWQGEGLGWLGEGLGYFGEGLGWQGEGLGFASNGLGVGAGLSTENFYGTDHTAMTAVLRKARDLGVEFGFIFFEACNSNVGASRKLSSVLSDEMDNVDAYYSAQGSLWYRNIDWHTLLFWAQAAEGDASVNLTRLATEWSARITTFTEDAE